MGKNTNIRRGQTNPILAKLTECIQPQLDAVDALFTRS